MTSGFQFAQPESKILRERASPTIAIEWRTMAMEVSAPEPAKPGLDAAKDEAGPGIVEAAGKNSPLPPKPVEKLADGGERVDRIGLKIAALLAVDPVVDHSVSATPARRREQRARHDAFDPSQHPDAPGAPRPLGIIREYASGQPAN